MCTLTYLTAVIKFRQTSKISNFKHFRKVSKCISVVFLSSDFLAGASKLTKKNICTKRSNLFDQEFLRFCKANLTKPALIPQIEIDVEVEWEEIFFFKKKKSFCELKWKTWQKFISEEQFFAQNVFHSIFYFLQLINSKCYFKNVLFHIVFYKLNMLWLKLNTTNSW